MLRIGNPFPLFVDGRGALVDAGYIYIGAANQDPRSSPLSTFTDQGLTTPIAPPLRTLGGFIVDGESPCFVYVGEDDYSIRVEDANGQLVEYVPSVALVGEVDYQPLSSTLTLLAALSTTTFGRNLLALANQAALQAAVGTPATLLAKVGGAMSGDISRSGAGVYVFWSDGTMASGRLFKTASGAADPTSVAGDIWFEEQ